MELEGLPRGLSSWNAFRAAYAKLHRGTPQARVGEAYRTYQAARLASIEAPEERPKKSPTHKARKPRGKKSPPRKAPSPKKSPETPKPPPRRDVLSVLRSLQGYDVFARLLELSGEATRIDGLSDVTVFAPNDPFILEALGHLGVDAALAHPRARSVLAFLERSYLPGTRLDVARLNEVIHYHGKEEASRKGYSTMNAERREAHYTFKDGLGGRVRVLSVPYAEFGRPSVPSGVFAVVPLDIAGTEDEPAPRATIDSEAPRELSNGVLYETDALLISPVERQEVSELFGARSLPASSLRSPPKQSTTKSPTKQRSPKRIPSKSAATRTYELRGSGRDERLIVYEPFTIAPKAGEPRQALSMTRADWKTTQEVLRASLPPASRASLPRGERPLFDLDGLALGNAGRRVAFVLELFLVNHGGVAKRPTGLEAAAVDQLDALLSKLEVRREHGRRIFVGAHMEGRAVAA